MGESWIGILLVLAVAGSFIGVSYLQKYRAQSYLDGFAEAYWRAVTLVLDDPNAYRDAVLATVPSPDGGLRVAPLEQQPVVLRALLEKGVGQDAVAELQKMFEDRAEVGRRLSGLNLVGKRIFPVLNNMFDLLNESFALICNYQEVEFDPKTLERFHFFLHRQQHVRTVTLPSVTSLACQKRLNAD